MEKMTITRALSELKLLDSKIQKLILETRFVDASEGDKPPKGFSSVQEFQKYIESLLQSYDDLCFRRNKIKAAVVKSNADTMVSIGNQQYTVADVIERKRTIQTDTELLLKMKQAYMIVTNKVSDDNARVYNALDAQLTALYGKTDSKKISEEDHDAVAKPYLKKREWKVVTCDGFNSFISKKEAIVEEFLMLADIVLSESNAVTTIEV